MASTIVRTSQIIGYDARRIDVGWRELRPAACWEMFLLRKDLDQPLSTDAAVWDRALEWNDPDVPTPAWIGPYADLWDNLDDLDEFLVNHHSAPVKPYWVIAVQRFEHEGSAPPIEWDSSPVAYLSSTCPRDASPDWTLLGYDVSDWWQLSGLLNCGYSDEDEVARKKFARKLNRYHLFEAFDDANAFRLWTDERVSEHAPFFVHGLYRVREVA